VVLAVICALVGFGLWNLFNSPNDTRLAAIRAHGYPITLAELDAWYKALPDEQNAALIYKKAFALTVIPSTTKVGDLSRSRQWMPKRGQSLTPEQKVDLTELLATNGAALGLYHSAVPDQSRYPMNLKDGFNTLLPHLAEIKKGVGLLEAEAWVHVANGEQEKAVASLLAAGRLADSLSEEPLIVSQLVRIACWGSICTCMERIINVKPFSEEQLISLQNMLARDERPQAAARALAGERACGLSMFNSRNPRGVLGSYGASPRLSERIGRGLVFSALKLTGILQKDRNFYMTAMETNIATAELDFPGRFSAAQQIPPSVALPSSQLCIVSAMILPALQKTFVKDAEHAAHIRVAKTAVAVERFRRANGNALPKDLAELTPAFMKEIPADPFDGKPLRFKLRGEGYVIYSIGSDGLDNGGTEYDPRVASGTDVTFVAER
jgi:hypothetical protein